MWNGAARQPYQRQYQAGTIFGAAGRGPDLPDSCQLNSAQAHLGSTRGSLCGRFDGSTTSGGDGPLTLPAASVAITRKTLGAFGWMVATAAVVWPGIESSGRLPSVTR